MTQRASLKDYRNVNGVIAGTASDGTIALMVPDPALLILLLALEGDGKIEQFDRDDLNTAEYLPWFDYGLKLEEDGWLPIDADELYSGNTISISLGDNDQPTFIGKSSLPIKLKKTEFIDITYRVFLADRILGVSKKFSPFPEHNFTIVKLFQII